MARTVTTEFGQEAADKLAALAIDVACDAPLRQAEYVSDTKIRWSLIDEIRAALDQAGIDWRELASNQQEAEQKARERVRSG